MAKVLKPKPKPRWNVELMAADMALRGWNTYDVARRAGKAHKTIHRFLTGDVQTTKTAAAIAKVFGFSTRRYFLGVEVAA